jgi:hypothetical protein
MSWTPLPFSKHKGLTLPQVILSDPDWVFWAVANIEFYGLLEREIADLYYKARHIRICKPDPENWQVEYRYDEIDRFLGFWVVPVTADIGKPKRSIGLAGPILYSSGQDL